MATIMVSKKNLPAPSPPRAPLNVVLAPATPPTIPTSPPRPVISSSPISGTPNAYAGGSTGGIFNLQPPSSNPAQAIATGAAFTNPYESAKAVFNWGSRMFNTGFDALAASRGYYPTIQESSKPVTYYPKAGSKDINSTGSGYGSGSSQNFRTTNNYYYDTTYTYAPRSDYSPSLEYAPRFYGSSYYDTSEMNDYSILRFQEMTSSYLYPYETLTYAPVDWYSYFPDESDSS